MRNETKKKMCVKCDFSSRNVGLLCSSSPPEFFRIDDQEQKDDRKLKQSTALTEIARLINSLVASNCRDDDRQAFDVHK